MFDRQWLHRKNAEDMKFRNQLAAIVSAPETAELNLDFDEVLTKCREMLEKIMTGMSKPFLTQAAEMVCKKLQAECSLGSAVNIDTSSGDDTRMAAVEKLAAEQLANDATKSSAVQSNGSATASHFSGTESADIMSVDDLWRPSTEWRKKGAVKVAGKQPWTNVEEEQVYRGVLAHGVGNWALIHTDYVPTRSNVDIKDKWRTMKRQGRLKTLADKLGPLPASCLY